ncbi:MAG: hypothetical protein JO047_09725 [Alphaproteobacteria bacterium]|nr:hypothetical protein [Alphaproteobacteria bacterium]
MSETLQAARREWVERVLGVRVGSGATTSPTGDFKQQWQQSFAAFRDAIETVDQQMDALGGACRQTKNAWLVNIADLGLPAVTGNFKTPLMAACLEVSSAPAEKVAGAAAKARTALANFAQHIATDPQVAGCDGNPFGVAVSIRATLGPALKSLNDALHSAS